MLRMENKWSFFEHVKHFFLPLLRLQEALTVDFRKVFFVLQFCWCEEVVLFRSLFSDCFSNLS